MPAGRALSDSELFFPGSHFLVRILRRARHGVIEAMDDMSGSPKGSTAAVSETEHLAPEEVLEKLDSLSADDKRRLRLIERRRRGGTDFRENELYSEAVCQAVVGERNCPKDESFVAFLAQSMRSIASHRREALGRTESLTPEDDGHGGAERQVASDGLDPEALLIETQSEDAIKIIYDALEGDEEAQLAV